MKVRALTNGDIERILAENGRLVEENGELKVKAETLRNTSARLGSRLRQLYMAVGRGYLNQELGRGALPGMNERRSK